MNHQSSTWKLFTLVGIIVVGCLVIVQVQKGLPDASQKTANELDDLKESAEKFDFDFGGVENSAVETAINDRMPTGGYRAAAPSSDAEMIEDDPIFAGAGDQHEPDVIDDVASYGSQNSRSPYYDGTNPFAEQNGPAPTQIQQAGYTDDASINDVEAPGQAALGSVDDDFVFDDEVDPVVDSYGDAPRYAGGQQPAPKSAPVNPQTKTQPIYFGKNDPSSKPVSINSNPVPASIDDAFGDTLDVVEGFGAGVAASEFEEFPDFPTEDAVDNAATTAEPYPLDSEFDRGFQQEPAAVAPSAFPPADTSGVSVQLDGSPFDDDRQPSQTIPSRSRGQRVSAQPSTYRREPNTQFSQETATPRRFNPRQQRSAVLPVAANGEVIAPLIGNGRVARNVSSSSSLRPQLQIRKDMPQNAVLGKPLVYSIIVTNIGNARARQVVVEDQIPRGCQLKGTIPQAQVSSKENDRLVWNLGTMDPDEEAKIRVRVIPISEGQIGSTATVNFAAEVASQTTITAPKILIQLTGPKEVMIGDAVVYKYRLTNEGSGEASNVIIRSALPKGLEHPQGPDLEYPIGSIPPGASRDVTLKLAAVQPGDLLNSAVVTADGGISKKVDAPITVIGQQLDISRRGPARRYIGRPGTYENVVVNVSRRRSVNAVVFEKIPPGMQFVSAGAGGQYDRNRRQVAWKINSLEPNQEKILQVTLKPTSSGEQASVVQVMEQSGLTMKKQSMTVVKNLMTMGLDISEVDAPVAVGEKMQFTIRARNRGTAATRNVRLAVFVPSEFQVRSAGPMGARPVRNAENGQEIQFDALESIEAGKSRDFTITLLAAQLAAGESESDVRLRAVIQSDEMQKPLQTERAIRIYSDR